MCFHSFLHFLTFWHVQNSRNVFASTKQNLPPQRPQEKLLIPAGFRPGSGRFPAGFRPYSGRIPAGFRPDSGRIPARSRPEPRIVFGGVLNTGPLGGVKIRYMNTPRRQVADANWPPPYAPHPPTINSILRVYLTQSRGNPNTSTRVNVTYFDARLDGQAMSGNLTGLFRAP